MSQADSLQLRVITALILMAGLVAATTLLSPFAFAIFVVGICMLCAWEWAGFLEVGRKRGRSAFMFSFLAILILMFPVLGITPDAVRTNNLQVAILLSLGLLFWILCFFVLWGYPDNAHKWNDKSKIALMGLFAILPTFVGLVQLKYLLPSGFLVIGLIIMVAAVDVGAYFFGVALGHTKLAPRLSPNKSWEGVWGGLFTCFLLGCLLTWVLHSFLIPLGPVQVVTLVLMSLTVTFFGVTGDLLESMLKRNCNIKDSGAILPGHGGFLDRVDGILGVTPAFVLTLLVILRDIL